MDPKPLTILQLQASNVKRLRAVNIRPDGQVVVLGGKNGAGKSSVLDAITYALAGERAICREPLRRGAEKGEVEIDLGEFRVRRTFTKEGGGSLSVLSPEGARYPSPQSLLDKVTGRLTFDPLAFAGMEAAQQAETLRRLLGLDFTAADADRARVFEQRTAVNRDGKALRARFDAALHFPDAPAAEVSSADILAEQAAAARADEVRLAKARETNRAHEVRRTAARDAARDATFAEQTEARSRAQVETTRDQIRRLQEALRGHEAELQAAAGKADEARRLRDRLAVETAALVDDTPPITNMRPFADRLAAVEETNRKVRANATRAELERQLEAKRAEALALSARLDEIDRSKAEAIGSARMPVAGLGFDATGTVTLNGLPLDQASHAERLRVSVAIGLAMNPRLKVLLIRDASLLDEDGLRLVAEMAIEAGAQVWLERVGKDDATTVLIEDGAVAEATAPAQA